MSTETAKSRELRDCEAHESSLEQGRWGIDREKIWVLHRALVECGADSSTQETLRNLGQKPADGLFSDEERAQLKDKYFKMLIAL